MRLRPLLFVALCSLPALASAAPSPREELIPLGTDVSAPRAVGTPDRQGPRAELLGQVHLSNRVHALTLPGRACSRREEIRALRLRVLNGPALLEDLSASFPGGARATRRLRAQLPPNSDSGWLALGPVRGGRCVHEITVTGRNANLSPAPTVVQVFALVDDAPSAPSAAKHPHAPRSR